MLAVASKVEFTYTAPPTKIRHMMQWKSLQYQVFISDLNKSGDDKFFHQAGRILQI